MIEVKAGELILKGDLVAICNGVAIPLISDEERAWRKEFADRHDEVIKAAHEENESGNL